MTMTRMASGNNEERTSGGNDKKSWRRRRQEGLVTTTRRTSVEATLRRTHANGQYSYALENVNMNHPPSLLQMDGHTHHGRLQRESQQQ